MARNSRRKLSPEMVYVACLRKVHYDTEVEAERERQRLSAYDRLYVHVYQCPNCQKFCLTSNRNGSHIIHPRPVPKTKSSETVTLGDVLPELQRLREELS